MRRALAPLVLVLATLAVAGCGYLQREAEPYRPPVYYGPAEEAATGADPVAVGQHLYLRDCAYCHGSDGKGTSQGPDITVETNGGALTDFVLRTGRMPVAGPVEQMSPREPVYSEQEIDAIVAYVTKQFNAPGPPVPHIDLTKGDLHTGQEVYQEHCGACHAPTGVGGAMLIHPADDPEELRGITIPDFERSNVLAVAEAVRTGPGSMPVFGERAISEHELESLLVYMRYLKDPKDEGGAPIGRIGPVVEGAVGWILGLGLLVLVTRWIGTKAGAVE